MIVLVCGMHRSGTSALAGMLHHNGICMGMEDEGDFYPPPMKENPKGFYENIRFRRINDAILHLNDYRVKSFDSNIPIVDILDSQNRREKELKEKMKSLIRLYDSTNECWGWKDPRTNLTILTWLNIMQEMNINLEKELRIIYMMRPTNEIAESMRARGNKEIEEGQFERLADKYALRFSEAYNYYASQYIIMGQKTKDYLLIPLIILQFKNLIENTESEALRLSVFLQKKITDTSFIDPKIAKNIK